MFRIKGRINRFDRLMMAVTFAEAGEQEMATDMMNRKPKRKGTGLKIRKRTVQRPVLRV